MVMNAAQDYQNRNITDSNLTTECFVTLHNELKTQEDRTMSVNNSLRVLCENGLIPGWRNEVIYSPCIISIFYGVENKLRFIIHVVFAITFVVHGGQDCSMHKLLHW